jgi:hypothetical protein
VSGSEDEQRDDFLIRHLSRLSIVIVIICAIVTVVALSKPDTYSALTEANESPSPIREGAMISIVERPNDPTTFNPE